MRPVEMHPRNLDELLAAVLAGRYEEREMADLPTFGGEEPDSTHGVFSWDGRRLLIQVSDARGFAIVERS